MGIDYQQYPFRKGKHPPDWIETTVGEVIREIRSGYSSGKHNQAGQGIPHLRPMNVSPEGEISMENVRYVSPNAGDLRVAKNDILFTNTSSTPWVGKTALVERPDDWGFSNHMTRLRAADGISPEYAARQLHYLCLSGYFSFHCKKHINQSSVAGRQLAENVPFRLPPEREQKRIVAKLRPLLSREHKLRQQLEELRPLIQQYRSAVLEAACTGRLVPTEAELARKERRDFEPASILLERILVERRAKWETDQLSEMRMAGKEPSDDKWKRKYISPLMCNQTAPDWLPSGWVWTSIDSLLAEPLTTGISVAGKDAPPGVPSLRLNAMTSDGLDYTKVRYLPLEESDAEGLWVRNKDFFVSRGSGSQALVGRGVLASEPPGKFIFSDKMIRLRFCSPLNTTNWPESIWDSFAIKAQIQLATKTTAGIWMITKRALAGFGVPLPPLAEQRRIVAEIQRRLGALAQLERQVTAALEHALNLRASLLHCAFSGQLAEQRKGDEPAKELLARIRIQHEKQQKKQKRKPPLRKAKMKKLSPEVVKQVISKLPKDRFTFEELSTALQTDYDPLKEIVFELLGESKAVLKQVFDPKVKAMQLERIKP